MRNAEAKVLELIRDHDGQYSWYQLEHVVYPSELPEGVSLRNLLKKLLATGLIREGVGPNPSQPVYSVTEAGVAAMQEAKTQGS